MLVHLWGAHYLPADVDVASLQAGGDSDIKTAQGLIITLLKLQQNNLFILLTLSVFEL